jgi:hypothetical protein
MLLAHIETKKEWVGGAGGNVVNGLPLDKLYTNHHILMR